MAKILLLVRRVINKFLVRPRNRRFQLIWKPPKKKLKKSKSK